MIDVLVGQGNLAGRGVRAARDFAVGEPVVRYELCQLSEQEYGGLSQEETLFVHSFYGRRYLYPAPARYVNHSDHPTCYQDFERQMDVALRPITVGEEITLDAHEETAHELKTFIDQFNFSMKNSALSKLIRDQRNTAISVSPELTISDLLDEHVVFWNSGTATQGRNHVTSTMRDTMIGPLDDVTWQVGTGRWEALCSAQTVGPVGRRHLTLHLKVHAGNWSITYFHLG